MVAGEVAGIGQFLFFLASRERASVTGKPGKSALPVGVAASREFLAPLNAILADWPAGFDDLVRRRLSAGDQSQETAAGRLGNWYHGLMRFSGEAYQPFRERLLTVVQETLGDHYLKVPSADAAEVPWMSAAAAAARLGVRPERIIEAVASGEIEGRIRCTGFGHRHCSVSSDTVAAIEQDRARFRDARAMAAMLGISRGQLRLLGEAGLLPTAPTRPVLTDGTIDSVALGETVARTRSEARARPGRTIAFASINLRRTTDRAALIETLRSIFGSSVTPVFAAEDAPLGDFEFLASDIDAELARLRRGHGWTAEQVAEITGWKEQCVSEWCRQGLIEAAPFARSRGTGYTIAPEALAGFQAKFVTVAALAREASCSPRGMLSRLAESGVATCGSLAEGGARRGHLVRIADLAAARHGDRPASAD